MAPQKRPTYPCRCAACGWKSARGLKNMNKPCPKCGGPVDFQSTQDKEGAQLASLITIFICIAIALVLIALGKT